MIDARHPTIQLHYVLGMRMDYAERSILYKEILGLAKASQSSYCCVPNVHMCMEAYDNPEFRDTINSADVVFSDSVILERSRSFLYGVNRHETLRGAQMLLDLCAGCEAETITVGFYGGSEETIVALRSNIQRKYPNLHISYAHSPPFRSLRDAEMETVIRKIQTAKVQLLFVGIGCPKQEIWIAENKGKIDACMIGVGAAFDFNAGTVAPSPAWVHRAGLEWLYRLISEPRRLWRRHLSTAPRFILKLISSKLSGRG